MTATRDDHDVKKTLLNRNRPHMTIPSRTLLISFDDQGLFDAMTDNGVAPIALPSPITGRVLLYL